MAQEQTSWQNGEMDPLVFKKKNCNVKNPEITKIKQKCITSCYMIFSCPLFNFVGDSESGHLQPEKKSADNCGCQKPGRWRLNWSCSDFFMLLEWKFCWIEHILFFPGFFYIVHWSCFISSRALAEWKLSSVCLPFGRIGFRENRMRNLPRFERFYQWKMWFGLNEDLFFDFKNIQISPFASTRIFFQISPSLQLEKKTLVSQQQKHAKKTQKNCICSMLQHEKSETPTFGPSFFFWEPFASSRFVSPLFVPPPSNARRLREPAADFGKAPPGTDDLGVGLDHGSGGCASVMAYENQWVSLNKAENGTLVYVRVVY